MKIKLWGVTGSIPSPLSSNEIEKKVLSACKKYHEFLKGKTIKELARFETIKSKDVEKIITKIFLKKSLRADNFIPSLSFVDKGTYRGNTACVEVRCGEQLIIIDAGTGIRNLGVSLLNSEFGKGKGKADILLSHTHFDHIDGWPFFAPAYIPGNHFDIYGPKHPVEEDKDLKTVFEEYMKFSYFPVFSLKHMGATVQFHDIGKGTFYLDKIKVSTQPLQHTCRVLGYRLEYEDKVVVYESDSEPYSHSGDGMRDEGAAFIVEESNKGVIELAKNADVLIYDTQYTPEEYDPAAYGLKGMGKKGWGHSTYEHAIECAVKAEAKRLIMFHHDPQHNDEFIQNMWKRAQKYAKKANFKGVIDAAYEGMTIEL